MVPPGARRTIRCFFFSVVKKSRGKEFQTAR
jgi:hypothetical protein